MNSETITQVFNVVTAAVALAAAVAAFTPTPKDDGVVAKLRGLIDLLAMNFLNARNKD